MRQPPRGGGPERKKETHSGRRRGRRSRRRRGRSTARGDRRAPRTATEGAAGTAPSPCALVCARAATRGTTGLALEVRRSAGKRAEVRGTARKAEENGGWHRHTRRLGVRRLRGPRRRNREETSGPSEAQAPAPRNGRTILSPDTCPIPLSQRMGEGRAEMGQRRLAERVSPRTQSYRRGTPCPIGQSHAPQGSRGGVGGCTGRERAGERPSRFGRTHRWCLIG